MPTRTFIVDRESAGSRLRDYLKVKIPGIPPKGIRRAIQRGLILLEGQRVASNTRVQGGQQVTAQLPGRNGGTALPGVPVLYEDDFLAAVAKPENMVTSGGRQTNLAHGLNTLLKASTMTDALLEMRPVHRLDAATSGVLLIAKTTSALRALSNQFAHREVEKTYVAIVSGNVRRSQTIEDHIQGRSAITELHPESHIHNPDLGDLTYLRLHPRTGRTHQLRKHLAQIGHPVAGDTRYGGRPHDMGMFLHARELCFTHPATGAWMCVTAPLPEKFLMF